MEAQSSGVGMAPGGICRIAEDSNEWNATGRETEVGADEAVRSGMLRRGKTAQNVRQRLQHSFGAGMDNGSGTGNQLVNYKNKKYDIYNLTCQETAPLAPAELNRPRRGGTRG